MHVCCWSQQDEFKTSGPKGSTCNDRLTVRESATTEDVEQGVCHLIALRLANCPVIPTVGFISSSTKSGVSIDNVLSITDETYVPDY